MSELKVDKVSPRTGNYVSLNTVGMKNIIINGDMSLAQRGTSVSVSDGSNEGYQTCDRYEFYLQNAGSVFTWSQDTDVPTGQGFAKSMKFDVTTADTSVGSTEEVNFRQKIEGQNLQYLKFGTANAEQLTLSFWVKTNKTGIYIVKLYNSDSGRDVSASYTVPDSNWNKYTLTFPADTTGSFTNDNGRSLDIIWWLVGGSDVQGGTLNTSWRTNADASSATGQVNFADSTSNDFLITGVQLEAGTTASDFEFLPVDVNLQRCQRYFYMHATTDADEIGIGGYYTSSQIFCDFQFPVSMRTTPSVYITTGTDYFRIFRNGAVDSFNSLTFGAGNVNMFGLYNNTEVSGTAGHAGFIRPENASAVIGADAEL
jgi:hypothetical protein